MDVAIKWLRVFLGTGLEARKGEGSNHPSSTTFSPRGFHPSIFKATE